MKINSETLPETVPTASKARPSALIRSVKNLMTEVLKQEQQPSSSRIEPSRVKHEASE